MDYSEKLVVKGLKEGDTEAYQYIFDTHYQVLCYTANRYVRDGFVAETIVGDMIYRMWEHRDTLNVNTSLRSYLQQAVRNWRRATVLLILPMASSRSTNS